jgi:putative membrane protein
MNLFLNLAINTLSVLAAAYVLKGVRVDGVFTALVVAVVLAAINAVIKPLLILLTLPITILTLGLFLFVINALMILLASAIVPGFRVENFWWALAYGLVLSAINAVLHAMA